ncbi:dTDP-4-dehydrorhamnose 3,5-epimerase [Streptomyces sp. TG1A-8]|uniref:dTDP-4-dehydrorhamnose 3,5-epimerase family protein n=1 Tax=Streptomyces sp. TG1A-8 TaxID=3051385 RepID=UPI00265BAE75|nr:dTDP-4-dehydrorhamnose 3,5-epimerase [Streptomyces sp. TG1A-8]MDO0926657.1 dTDP-4-dehydrorhamnose 3,5-epimerase [Streptomyces sp. TG1A-8]
MEIHRTSVPHAYLLVPKVIEDERGCFYEAFRHDVLGEAIGRPMVPVQSNYSVSRRGTLRGLHGVLLPPGQAKVVTCVRGEVLDVVVDIRPGSPAYLRHTAHRLSAANGRAVFAAEGLGHAFLALTDDACVNYLCSTTFVPGTQLDLDALDPELGLPWREESRAGGFELLRSPKDRDAPTVAEARRAGLLASYEECVEHYATLAARG